MRMLRFQRDILSHVEFQTTRQNFLAVNNFYRERTKKYRSKRTTLNSKYRKLLIGKTKTCPICNSNVKFELVHIIPVVNIFKVAEFLGFECFFDIVPEEKIWEIAYSKTNMIVLCHQCHRLNERSELLWSKKTLKILEKKRAKGEQVRYSIGLKNEAKIREEYRKLNEQFYELLEIDKEKTNKKREKINKFIGPMASELSKNIVNSLIKNL